jgi:hypothetical protein
MLKVAFIQQWPGEENEVVNKVCTTTEMPVPFDWATDVDGAVPIAPIILVDHGRTEHIITLVPMSHVPHDFSALRSSTQNLWASLRHRHRRSHPCACNICNSFKYVTYIQAPRYSTSSPPAPAPIQLVETIRHPCGIAPTKPVIRTISPSASTPIIHPSISTPSREPLSGVHLDSPSWPLGALLLDWSGDPFLAGLARILEALGWVQYHGVARTPLCSWGAHGVVGDCGRSCDVVPHHHVASSMFSSRA